MSNEKQSEMNKKIGSRLKSYLREKNLKQSELADILGYGSGERYISLIVNGKRSLTQEKAEIIAKKIPPVRAEWLMCRDDYKTEEDRNAAIEKDYLERYKAEKLYEGQIFPAFVTGLEDLRGYGLTLQANDDLLGQCVIITDKENRPVGSISVEAYKRFQAEVEHYATYLIRQIVNTEMTPWPASGKEGVDKLSEFKSNVLSREYSKEEP